MNNIPKFENYSEAEVRAAFERLAAEMFADFAACSTEPEVETVRIKWLGRKHGVLTAISETWLKGAPKEARRLIGQHFNGLRQQIEEFVLGNQVLAKGEKSVQLESAAATLKQIRQQSSLQGSL